MKKLLQQGMESYQKYVLGLLVDLKLYIIFVLFLFSVGIILGLTDIFNVNDYLYQMINDLLSRFRGYRNVELFAAILFQNCKAAAVMIYAGIFFSFLPVFAALMNGIVIGCVVQKISSSGDLSMFEVFLSLMPHGFFEIPTIIIALALGIRFGLWPFKGKKKEFIKNNFKQSTACLIKVIIPFLIIAALIETIGIEAVYSLNSK